MAAQAHALDESELRRVTAERDAALHQLAQRRREQGPPPRAPASPIVPKRGPVPKRLPLADANANA